jgi:vacuolar-type H+-ATPase subunit H
MNSIKQKNNEIMAKAQSKFKKLMDEILTEHSKKGEYLVEELKLELTQTNSEIRQLKYEAVQSYGTDWKEINSNSILNKIPTETFDNLLKYLPLDDIKKLLITCDTINQRVRKSFYETLKSKVEDWSIYQNAGVCKRAREYLSLDYVRSYFQIGERPKVEEDIILGDNFEVNAGVQVYNADQDDHVELTDPSIYFNTDPMSDLDLNCTWLLVKTINLQLVTRLYYYIN